MHSSALANGKLFFETYVNRLGNVTIVDIGSQNVNGSLRQFCPPDSQYVGLDFAPGAGVDVVLKDPYAFPLKSGVADVVVSSSCFEHSEMFWLVFTEALRILKPRGLLYLNVPSNGPFHRFPVDCWRFYPDSGHALVSWATRCGINAMLLESYIARQSADDYWSDYVGVFVKSAALAEVHPNRILASLTDFDNGFVAGLGNQHLTSLPEDLRNLAALRQAQGRLPTPAK